MGGRRVRAWHFISLPPTPPWQRGDSEVLWRQTFPLAAGERLSRRLVHGSPPEESLDVVRLFAPTEER